MPFVFGALAGWASYLNPNDGNQVPVLTYFQQISKVYLLALMLITMSFAVSCIFILKQIVIDKENKMRESLKIMSMSRCAYALSYFCTQAVFSFVTAVLVTVGLMWKFDNSNGIAGSLKIVLFATILFGFALIAFSMTLSTLFSDSKLSPQIGMYILLLPTSVYFYVMPNRINVIERFNPTLGYKLFPLCYLMPNFSFSVIMLDFYI